MLAREAGAGFAVLSIVVVPARIERASSRPQRGALPLSYGTPRLPFVENPGGVEPLGGRIKSPLPDHLGLERSGSLEKGEKAKKIVMIGVYSRCELIYRDYYA